MSRICMEIEDILLEARETTENFLEKNKDGTIMIWGATATGKSKLSVLLSDFFSSEIISADSRQIFRKMDIGTDKISKDIRKKVPHHQIDIVDPDETYTAGQRKEDVDKQVNEILKRKKVPMIVGGTGLYLDSIYKNYSLPECPPNPELRKQLNEEEEKHPGYLYEELMKIDPAEARKLHPNSTRYLTRALEIWYGTGKTKTEGYQQQPVSHPLLMIGLWREKEETNLKINKRIKEMIQHGLLEEVQGLLDQGYTSDLQSMGGIGYKEVIGYLRGEYSLEKMEEILKRNTHYLAKKQRTWFRRYIAEGIQTPKENVEYKVFHL